MAKAKIRKQSAVLVNPKRKSNRAPAPRTKDPNFVSSAQLGASGNYKKRVADDKIYTVSKRQKIE